MTYVIGHKNPDTDTICSAIGYAALKNTLEAGRAQAARAGDLNPETTFVLERFGLAVGYLLSFNFNRTKEPGLSRVVVGDSVLWEETV